MYIIMLANYPKSCFRRGLRSIIKRILSHIISLNISFVCSKSGMGSKGHGYCVHNIASYIGHKFPLAIWCTGLVQSYYTLLILLYKLKQRNVLFKYFLEIRKLKISLSQRFGSFEFHLFKCILFFRLWYEWVVLVSF